LIEISQIIVGKQIVFLAAQSRLKAGDYFCKLTLLTLLFSGSKMLFGLF
jgi:hypothetical protein